MSATKFPVKKFRNAQGHVLEGELIVESTLAFQVAVNGNVQVLQKSEWVQAGSQAGGFEDLFSMFGGR